MSTIAVVLDNLGFHKAVTLTTLGRGLLGYTDSCYLRIRAATFSSPGFSGVSFAKFSAWGILIVEFRKAMFPITA